MLDLVTRADAAGERYLRYRSIGLVIITVGVTIHQLFATSVGPPAAILIVVAGALIGAAATARRRWPLRALTALYIVATLTVVLCDGLSLGIWGWLLTAFVATCWVRSDNWQWVLVAIAIIGPGIVILTKGIGVTAAIGVTLAMTATAAIGYAMRSRALLAVTIDEREQLARQTRDLETRNLLAEERTRIARDLHDALSQSLAIISAQADGAQRILESDPEAAADALKTISYTSRQAQAQVRETVFELRDSQVVTGRTLVPALEDLIAKVGYANVRVQTTFVGDLSTLTEPCADCLYLIAREALTNVLKHADPSQPAHLSLTTSASWATLVVTNQADAAPGDSSGADIGNGISSMRERAESLKGTLDVSRSGAVFGVVARVPTQEAK